MNRPQSIEGEQIWDLVGRIGGQLRIAGSAVIGWDMGAVLAMAAALSVSPLAVAEFLPGIEAVMVRKMNERLGSGEDG